MDRKLRYGVVVGIISLTIITIIGILLLEDSLTQETDLSRYRGNYMPQETFTMKVQQEPVVSIQYTFTEVIKYKNTTKQNKTKQNKTTQVITTAQKEKETITKGIETTKEETNLQLNFSFGEKPINYNSWTSTQQAYYGYTKEISSSYPNVTPAMVMAIIERESNFDASSHNSICHGLMGIHSYYNTDRMARLGVTNLYDPYQNIMVGTDLLEELYQLYGNWSDALYHYSGGIGGYYNMIMSRMGYWS